MTTLRLTTHMRAIFRSIEGHLGRARQIQKFSDIGVGHRLSNWHRAASHLMRKCTSRAPGSARPPFMVNEGLGPPARQMPIAK